MIDIELPKQQRKQQLLYDMLRSGADVSVTDISLGLGLPADRVNERDDRARSYAQCRIIAFIVRLNRHLAKHKLKVRPGRTKHTYCLTPLT